VSELQNPEIYRTVLDSLETGVCVVDLDGRIAFWNQGATHVAGYMHHEVIGRPCQEFMSCPRGNQEGAQSDGKAPFGRILHEGKATMVALRLRHRRGHQLPVLMHVSPVRNQHGSVIAIVASFDSHSLKLLNDRGPRNALPLAGLDVSTGVANRSFSLFHLREQMASFVEYRVPFGILRVRANAFDQFCASYGREAGSAALLVMAQTLSNSFRPSDFVGRWGEDEFLVILTNCAGAGIRSLYERTQKSLSSVEIRWWGESLRVATSIGCSSVELGDTIELLLSRAEEPGTATSPPISHVEPKESRSS
jgi:diguanylate cyclase (GGDEF)-like protein/PAS domain S-box-containing protein